MQAIPAGYTPTLTAANAYLNRNADVAAAYAAANPSGNYDPVSSAWQHYRNFGNSEGRLWDFVLPSGPIPPVLTGPITSQPTETGILSGKIFGVDTKLILIAAAAYFVFSARD